MERPRFEEREDESMLRTSQLLLEPLRSESVPRTMFRFDLTLPVAPVLEASKTQTSEAVRIGKKATAIFITKQRLQIRSCRSGEG